MTPAPKTCPVCGSVLLHYNIESEEEYEAWEFECSAIILRGETGKLIAESDCENATQNAVRLLNETALAVPSADGGGA